jgi:hypothetical protein
VTQLLPSDYRLLARNTIKKRLVQLVAEKTQIFKHFAHDSSARDASLMAVDTSGDFEMDCNDCLTKNPESKA